MDTTMMDNATGDMRSMKEGMKGMMHDKMSSMRDGMADMRDRVSNMSEGVSGGQHEGTATKAIESVTSRIPSVSFLSMAMGAMACAGWLHYTRRTTAANLVGQAVPALLIMGLYNKLVKLEGSE